MFDLLFTAWDWLGFAGGLGGVATGALGFLGGFRFKALAIAAAGGLIAATLIAGTFYVKGYRAASAACDYSSQKDQIAELERQNSAGRIRSRQVTERAIEERRKREARDAKITDLNHMLDGLVANPVCLDADTARVLDGQGR